MAVSETAFKFQDAMTSAYLTPRDVEDLNRQGQFAGLKMPRTLARKLGCTLEADPDEPQRKRLVDDAGQRWRVVVGGQDGFSLVRSEMKGKGRSVDPAVHAQEQADLAGYLLVDVEAWPVVRVVVRRMTALLGVEAVRRTTFDQWFGGPGLF